MHALMAGIFDFFAASGGTGRRGSPGRLVHGTM
jgi:hypothetical protein